MNRPQQTIIVVAAGLAIATVIGAINRSLLDASGGWFNYSPNSGVIVQGDDSRIWQEAAMWLVGIAGWVAIAFAVYRNPR